MQIQSKKKLGHQVRGFGHTQPVVEPDVEAISAIDLERVTGGAGEDMGMALGKTDTCGGRDNGNF